MNTGSLVHISIVLSILAFLAAPFFSQAGELDMGITEKTYCTDIDGYEYCLDFVQLPWGPGLNVEAILCVSEADPVFSGGPRCMQRMKFGEALQRRSGEPFKFYGELSGLSVSFDRGDLVLHEDVLTLEARER